jgi:acyl-CoA reductase-like NAD-dependent aldehyde dehydrogenase
METKRNYIDGVWVESTAGATIDVVDPATEERIAILPVGSEEDVDRAVAAARGAQPAWAALPLEERIGLITECADRIAEHVDELCELERQDMGKPVDIGMFFTAGTVAGFKSGAEEARDYAFETVLADELDGRTLVVRHPLGVAAVLAPWNFTIAVILGGLGPLLAAGNTVVVKPSEKSPLSAIRLFELFESLPAGVVNLVLGDGHAGRPLAAHPGVDLVQFTGSVRTGQAVGAAAGANLNRAVLELGGKDPVVVDSDVDVAQTAKAVAYAAFANTGQICTSMERIYVHHDIADEFVAELVEEARKLSTDEGVLNTLGPLVDAGQRDLVHRHVVDAVERGATIEIGGEIPDGRGFFYPATVLTGVDESMLIMNEETFGPVAPVQVVDSFAEGVQKAAQTDFGLAATVYTNNPEHVRAAHKLPAGLVWVNRWQGGAAGMIYEPAKNSGLCATGGRAAYDAATRPATVHEGVPALTPA